MNDKTAPPFRIYHPAPSQRDAIFFSWDWKFRYLAATRFHLIVALHEPTRESEDFYRHGHRENYAPSGTLLDDNSGYIFAIIK